MDAAPATRGDRELRRDGRARDAYGALPRAPASPPLQPRPRHGHSEEGAAPDRAAARDPHGDAGRRARDARLVAAAARLCWRVSAKRARALDVEQLRFSKAGCYVWLASAKNDPRKKGRELFVPRLPATSPKVELCAVAAIERWLTIVGPPAAVFRTFDLRGLRHRTASSHLGRLCGAFAATWLYNERSKKESANREYQGRDRATIERHRAQLHCRGNNRQRTAVTRDHWLIS